MVASAHAREDCVLQKVPQIAIFRVGMLPIVARNEVHYFTRNRRREKAIEQKMT